MIIDGRHIALEVVDALAKERERLPAVVRLGVVMAEGDAATESFVRIKERVASRLSVELVREILPHGATTDDAIAAVHRLAQTTGGVIVQLPLPKDMDTDAVLRAIPATHDVDVVSRPQPKGPGESSDLSGLRAPVAEAISEIFARAGVSVRARESVVVGAGRLVGVPAAQLLADLGAHVSVVTLSDGSLDSLREADIVILGAGRSCMVQPHMLKKGVVLIDAGTSEQGGRVMGDAAPECAEVASVFTPVPGGVGPIAVAMIFKNLFSLIKRAG